MQALDDAFRDRGVTALVINVMESPDLAARWAKELGWTIPVLLDADGGVAARFAPAGVLPDLPRHQIPIASNLIIDREGKIRFYSLLDSRNFDARLVGLTSRLEALLGEESR